MLKMLGVGVFELFREEVLLDLFRKLGHIKIFQIRRNIRNV